MLGTVGTFFKNASARDWVRDSQFKPILSYQGLLLGFATYPAQPKHKHPLHQWRNMCQSLGNTAKQGWDWWGFALAAFPMDLNQHWRTLGRGARHCTARTWHILWKRKEWTSPEKQSQPWVTQVSMVRSTAVLAISTHTAPTAHSLAFPCFVPLVLITQWKRASGASQAGECSHAQKGCMDTRTQEIQHSPLRSRHTEQHVHTERGAEH